MEVCNINVPSNDNQEYMLCEKVDVLVMLSAILCFA